MKIKPLRGRDSVARQEARTLVKKAQRQTFWKRKEAQGRELVEVKKHRKRVADDARKALRQSKFFM